ncbi:Sulfur carrier protein adenylyltransferase ThiF [hydrothermal vent metagenome]|uniref:Sulfur carrier protein adenylyltransferase ThiF n=1 Tax=hydrothermal vent metagenome TaxID=652676 RepID=A0A160VDD4_9ZZZZ
MIVTPHELQRWIDEEKTFTVIDIRTKEQREEFQLAGLNPVVAIADAIPKTQDEKVLICQFGIVTEGIIIEKDLNNTFSLLGGAQAWELFKKESQDMSRWARQTVLPEIGIEGQKKLINATVALVGMGGLGCPVSQSLIASGIGKLKIIDGDKVELSNLHRQPLYGVEDIGRLKVQVAKKKLMQLNESAIVEPIEEFLNENNGLNFVSDATIIIDATDNIQTRQLIDRLSKKLEIPMVYGGLYRYEGQVAVLNANGSPGYVDLFPEPTSSGDACADAGVLGMLPGIIGNIQALEAVKLIVGAKPNLVGKLLIYNGMNHSTQTIVL